MFDAMVDPFTGKPYSFGTGMGQWWTDPYTQYASPTEGGGDRVISPGNAGISQEMAKYLGLDEYMKAHPELDQTTGTGENYNPDSDFRTKALTQLLAEKGLKLGQYGDGVGNGWVTQQLFDANNSPVGGTYRTLQDEDPGNLGMMLGLGMMGGFAGASALGGAAGDAGMSLAEGAYPSSLTAGSEAAGSLIPAGTTNMAAADPAWAEFLTGPEGASTFAPDAGALGEVGAAAPVAGSGSSLGSTLGDISPWAQQNPMLTNIGGSIVNGLIGGYQSNQAIKAQQNQTAAANALWAPYRDTGLNALGRINGLMSNPSSITSDPGYQFGLNQGTQGIDRSAASKGGLYSGATLKALDRYGQDYAGTKLNDAYARYGNVAQLGATGTTNMSNNLTNLGNAQAGQQMYVGNTLQNGVNNALGQWNFSNSAYGQPWNKSQYPGGTGP